MVKTEDKNKPTNAASLGEASSDNKQRNQGRKRKRCSSESSNEDEIILPDNALETERNVHASALKNNLDETSVRKIIKKVVTNDHVLALVKLREEEENSSMNDQNIQPKLTRAKVKELQKVSPQSAAWNLNLELTPIKHIPVKTRPEVKALIAQELPEDEDDEEYEPTNDDVPSDDDHVESCSDLDSQPRTPATPASQHSESPRVVKDGPFKVPQDVTSRRRLQIDEEVPTIALRTRSKLSLSSTSIEHIESTFVPPDDIPVPVDDLWNEFLTECLNPASTSKHEDDDEADPEYNVAADPDAQDEDEESLGRSLIKISKKELNDLVTELFNIIPESADTDLTDNLSNSVLTETSQSEITQWEGKQEPVSDDETEDRPSKKLTFENRENPQIIAGKIIPENEQQIEEEATEEGNDLNEKETTQTYIVRKITEEPIRPRPQLRISTKNRKIEISIEERSETQENQVEEAPPSLRNQIRPTTQTVCINVDSTAVTMTSEQILILQQQIRQHVQLATSNFLQLFVHPVHWKLAPTYKDYLTSLTKLSEKKEDSVVNVCNLKPAYELVTTWEASVSEDTEENRKMIEFIQSQVTRSRRRTAHNCLYVGDFHETFKNVVANSPVFLYPYLLPAMPYRPDYVRRYSYLHHEDTLIVLGIDQFWNYVESNPKLFKIKSRHPRVRLGYTSTMELVAKHMFPWMNQRTLTGHVAAVRSSSNGDKQNPIYRYFKFNEMPKIEHRLLPFNPSITLYEQPEHEMPKIWVKYLAKTSKRFRNFIHRRVGITGRQPEGVLINSGITEDSTTRKPLPIDFTKQIISHRALRYPKSQKQELPDRLDINIQPLNGNLNATLNTNTAQNPMLVAKNFFRLVETSTGAFLVPIEVDTNTMSSNTGPITTPAETSHSRVANNLPESRPKPLVYKDHCRCCVLLRKICKVKQMMITDYFKSKDAVKKCDCSDIKYPKMTNRLRLLVRNIKSSELVYKDLERILKTDERNEKTVIQYCDTQDIIHVLSYQLKLLYHGSMAKRYFVKTRIHNVIARFDIDTGDPIALATLLFKVFDTELIDLFLDFLTFLTPDQADKMGQFKDYFTRNCVKNLTEKVMEQVQDVEARHKILKQLMTVFNASKYNSCEICSGLLDTMAGYPALARYTFSLFPHRKENRTQESETVETVNIVEQNSAGHVNEASDEIDANDETDANEAMDENDELEGNEVNDAIEENDIMNDEPHHTMDYEADHSSFGEDSDALTVDVEEPLVEENLNIHQPIKKELPTDDPLEKPDTTISKPVTDEDDTSTSIYGDDNIKTEEEVPEWKREEDKIVLEVLKENLSPEERQGKTILEILELLEEKHIYKILCDSLADKSFFDVKERVLVLLTVVVLSVDNVQ